jgi:RNA polymerase sigma-70 factor (ECF subfamily)
VPAEIPDDEETQSATSELVHNAMNAIRSEFEPRSWQMFWRVVVDGHLPRDVAEDMGVTPDAVRMVKSRILRRLRQELGDLEEE